MKTIIMLKLKAKLIELETELANLTITNKRNARIKEIEKRIHKLQKELQKQLSR